MAQVLVLTVLLTLLSLGSLAPAGPPPVNTSALVFSTSPQVEHTDILETLLHVNFHLGNMLSEGDIVPKAANFPNGVLSNAAECTATTCKWPKGEDGYVHVPVVIDRKFSKQNILLIRQVMAKFAQFTCVRFEELGKRGRRQQNTDYISIIPDTGCWSYVGRIGGKQSLSLQQNGCMRGSIIEHEFNHALGFHHEHSRSDRDGYVNVHYENIKPGFEGNFVLRNTNNLQTPYDFLSVMQYNNWAFSKNGLMTLVAKVDPTLRFGHAETMSENDLLRINRLYDCTEYLV